MKTTNDYITILRKYLSTKADAYGITKIGIFGSVARNEQTEDSDVDICVEMKKPDLFTMVHIKEELQELFGKPVDIVRLRNNMNPMLLKQIKRDGIYAWRRTNHHYFEKVEFLGLKSVKRRQNHIGLLFAWPMFFIILLSSYWLFLTFQGVCSWLHQRQ